MNPATGGHQGGLLVRADRRARRDGDLAGSASVPRPPNRIVAAEPFGTGFDAVIASRRVRGRRVLRRAHRAHLHRGRGHGDAPGLRRHAVEQAVLLLRRGPVAGRRPDRSRRRPTAGPSGRNAAGATCRPSTSCPCPTSGSTRGSPPGTSPSTSVSLAHVDPAFAKYQLILVCREWFQHPNGALPAYEWDFGDVNPPVQAWAALEVFAIDGGRDLDFLSRILDKLMVNFTWWVNREDADGSNLFEGGFLGLDNIGPIDRSHLPDGDLLQQADATGWMGFYALSLGTIASILNRSGNRPTTDLVIKFIEHFTLVSEAMDHTRALRRAAGDVLRSPPPGRRDRGDGQGPLHGGHHSHAGLGRRRPGRDRPGRSWARASPPTIENLDTRGPGPGGPRCGASPATSNSCWAWSGSTRSSGWSPAWSTSGSSSRPMACGPCRPSTGTIPMSSRPRGCNATIDYEPAESTTPMFGGNSNWRGPVWYPLHYLVCSALERYGQLPRRRCAARLPHRLGLRSSLLPRSPTSCGRRVDRLFLQGRRRPAPVLRQLREDADRPQMEGQPPVQRVLPRRHRCRAWAPPTRRDGPAWWPIRSAAGTTRTSSPCPTWPTGWPARDRRPGAQPSGARPGQWFPLGATPARGRGELRRHGHRRRRGRPLPVRSGGRRDPGGPART